DYTFRNVAEQQSDPDSLLETYRHLIRLRRKLPALRQGMFMPLVFDPSAILAYLRQTSSQTVLVALNFSRRPTRFVLGANLSGPQWQPIFSSQRREPQWINSRTLQLAANEAVILQQR
ncbi:MAG TPA: DUF3459 domain-containing protein, partial [Anaerolineaceae bacterium]|nr:DUF3459 domain-containing protein [Anaerolineaceae bacterium]